MLGLLALLVWEGAVRLFDVPVYLVPGPIAIVAAFLQDPGGLLLSLVSTLSVTFAALVASAVMGAAMAIAMSASRLAQAAIQPWAVMLQVTPIVAIAPLIIVWVGDPFASLVVCAMIVAFFPVFANTATGLASAPPELTDLFRLYGGEPLAHADVAAAAGGAAIFPGRAADFRRVWRWWARWWRSSSRDPEGSPPAWRTAFWRRAIGCKFRACSRRWCCCRWPGSRSTWGLAGSAG